MRDYDRNFTIAPGETTTIAATLTAMGAASGSLRRIATIRLPASAGFSLDVDPHSNKIFASGGASAGQEVVMIDGAANKVVATLGTGSGAHVNPQTGKVYAANVYGGGIDVYSAGDGHLITTVKAFGCPVEAVVDPLRNQIWGGAQCGGGDDPVFRIDGSSDELTSQEIGSDGVMGPILVNPATHAVYVFAGEGGEGKVGPDRLSRIKAPFTTIVTAVDPDANRMYGAAASGNGVEVVDGATESVLAILPISRPGPIAVNPSNHRVYIVDNSTSPPQLKVFDGAANSLPMLSSLPLSSGDSGTSLAVNSSNARIYLLVQNNGVPSLVVIEDGV
jgi:DNA-binding beta-propeller fold protein YncE